MYIPFRQWLEAAEDERYAFKAVFTAGGPGSGKSALAQKMFPDFMIANSDQIQVLLSRNTGSPVASNPNDPRYPEFIKNMQQAQKLNAQRAMYWAKQGYPIVIDTTGRNIAQTKIIKDKLESLGYDTAMVFVNTTLDTARERNITRQQRGQHGAESDYLTVAWQTAQQNIQEYQRMFVPAFAVIDNDRDWQSLNAMTRSQIEKEISSTAFKLLGRPLSRDEVNRRKQFADHDQVRS